MTVRRTYLDWNATAPLLPVARDAMVAALALIGNPSSVHAEGRAARAVVEAARADVAALVGARPENVVFTSGASEANAWVMRAGWDFIVASAIEHDSVRAYVPTGRLVGADPSGVADVAAMARAVLTHDRPISRGLITLQVANNETGVLQPVAEMAAFARAHGLASFTDAVQAIGRMPVDLSELGVDFLALSGHKIGAPKGVGALILRGGEHLDAMIKGGGQERRRRAGTENVAAIAGLGAAARWHRARSSDVAALAARRDRMERRLLALSPDALIVGRDVARLANTSLVQMPGHSAETTMIHFDLAGVALSSGSACSSGTVAASHVLTAMGMSANDARSALRISLGPTTTDDDIDHLCRVWERVAAPQPRAA
jgi:cysteine desulfurase